MAISLAQSVVNGGTCAGSTVTATFGSNTTTGSTIIAITSLYSTTSSPTVSSVAVSAGSATFAKAIAQPEDGAHSYPSIEAWVAPSITGGTTPTVTATWSTTTTTNLASMLIIELAGMPSTTQTDGTASGIAGASVTAMVNNAITTVGSSDIICSGFAPSGDTNAGQGGSWVYFHTANNGCGIQYLLNATAQTALVTSATQTTSGIYGGIVFALKSTTPIAPTVSVNPSILFP